MFRPVGSQPPSVYWRRRIVLLASVATLLVLLVLTANVVFSGGSTPSSGSTRTTAAGNTPPVTSPSTSRTSSSKASSSTKKSAPTKSTSTSRSTAKSTPPPQPCTAKALSLAASSNKSSYSVGDEPVLSIVVTNTTRTACVQDLADRQIVLRVYNGESRVWGSHDCKVQPGTDDRTLMAGHSVRVSVVWSGLSSRAKCAGTRQRVGAGTYTLYASLAGHEAKAAQFAIG